MRAAKGEAVGAGDFDGLIRHARSEGAISDGQAQIVTRRRVVKARTPMQSTYIRALEKHDLVFGLGPAGTGKTYIAVAFAAQCLERGSVERIILSRPAVEAGERLGFLPGDMREKVDPYLRPLYDALYDVLPPEKVERDIETGVIEIAPLAFMRGRTLANAFVILDEAQNTTSMQMKMFLTRIGEGSKMVVTGDPSPNRSSARKRSGLEEAVELLSEVDDISAVRFGAGDIVRRDLVARIVDAYEKPKDLRCRRHKRSRDAVLRVELTEDDGDWSCLADRRDRRRTGQRVPSRRSWVANCVRVWSAVAFRPMPVSRFSTSNFRGYRPRPTNVLSFPAGAGAADGHLGDIVWLSKPLAREAQEQDVSLARSCATSRRSWHIAPLRP